jgi:hypothetical protein
VADDLPQPRRGDDRVCSRPSFEERLDTGQLLPQVQGHRLGEAEKITVGRLDLPVAKKAAAKRPATKRTPTSKTKAAPAKKAATK